MRRLVGVLSPALNFGKKEPNSPRCGDGVFIVLSDTIPRPRVVCRNGESVFSGLGRPIGQFKGHDPRLSAVPGPLPAGGGKLSIISPNVLPEININSEVNLPRGELLRAGDREFLPGIGNSGLALSNILVVLPVDRTSCSRVARSKRSGRLVKLPRF